MWMVRRDAFDQLLLDEAAGQGATVEMGVEVRAIAWEGDRSLANPNQRRTPVWPLSDWGPMGPGGRWPPG